VLTHRLISTKEELVILSHCTKSFPYADALACGMMVHRCEYWKYCWCHWVLLVLKIHWDRDTTKIQQFNTYCMGDYWKWQCWSRFIFILEAFFGWREKLQWKWSIALPKLHTGISVGETSEKKCTGLQPFCADVPLRNYSHAHCSL